ncbi:RNA polymerase [Frankia sp. R43]|uniref:RNA polymerase sigma factor n=1 Tax=Frankia sp. R43 TaxID=269536 RepID=UPI0006CA238B|nr:sigma-70 family RNA polymerase sigma factor [Frankia sp. R43]KPM50480.1 RNA polymerase [Frankia sp. R43]
MPASLAVPSFEALFREHCGAVLRFAQRRLESDEAAWDVVSETFLAAWRHWQRRPAASDEIRAWLYGIAGNVVRNQRRAGIRRLRLEVRMVGFGLATDPTALTGEDIADEAVRRDVAWQALERLSPEDREILQLAGWEGLDLHGLSVALAVSAATAKVRLHRARRRLEAALAEAASTPTVTEAPASMTLKEGS